LFSFAGKIFSRHIYVEIRPQFLYKLTKDVKRRKNIKKLIAGESACFQPAPVFPLKSVAGMTKNGVLQEAHMIIE
jgi:hypothetical protein